MTKLTRDETRALGAAIGWMDLCLRQDGPGTPEQIAAEKDRLKLARQALRKVNAIRKAQRAATTTKTQEQP